MSDDKQTIQSELEELAALGKQMSRRIELLVTWYSMGHRETFKDTGLPYREGDVSNVIKMSDWRKKE